METFIFVFPQKQNGLYNNVQLSVGLSSKFVRQLFFLLWPYGTFAFIAWLVIFVSFRFFIFYLMNSCSGDCIQATGGHHCLQGTDHINTVPITVDFDIFMLLILERCEDGRKKNTRTSTVSSQLELVFLLSINHDSKIEMCSLWDCLRLK